jgi:hypothetical protein
MNFNWLPVALALSITSASAFAAPCSNITSPTACNAYQTKECFWDVRDQRCENHGNNEDPCSSKYATTTACAKDAACFWDTDDKRCETKVTDGEQQRQQQQSANPTSIY